MIGGLYLITDHDRDGRLCERVEAALRGGARVVQYRDKEAAADVRLPTALRLAALCRQNGATFIVNDSAKLARESGADGVHLGQGDGTVAAARALLGEDKIVGISTRTVEQALAAEAQGADYIGLGAVFPTGTKGDAVHVGLERLRDVRASTKLPIAAIGGLDRDNAGEAIDAGADAVALVSAVMGDRDPALAAREIALLFNRRLPFPRGRILSVAGSDPGGGAGIQADLKTIALLGGYGMAAPCALTVQNSLGVRDIHPVPATFVAAQIEAVLSDLGADALKTGMLYDAAVIAGTARAAERYGLPAVVDPVMLSTSGRLLLQDDAVETLKAELLPRTFLLTPNLPEAAALTGLEIRDGEGMEQAARRLQTMGARHVLVKGGHLEGDAMDLLLAGDTVHRFRAPRRDTIHTHGTGCTFASAVATLLAQGLPLVESVARTKAFLTRAIDAALPLGAGHGPVNHWQGAKAITQTESSPPDHR